MIDFACKEFNLDEIIKCSLGLTKAEFNLVKMMLATNKEWFTTQELSKDLKLELSTIQRCVKSLHEKEILLRRQENLDSGGYLFHYQLKKREELRQRIKDTTSRWVAKVNDELDNWR
ncbi:MAG: MarR family transcriptional regulator [Candidatus Woesearchaeota archaeon]|jgi:predicted transcriptional regulator